MAGAEGWYYTVSIGASGDDYTGLVAPLARIALTVVAAVTLWRSRRTDDNRPWRYLRRTLIGVLSLIVAVMVVRPFIETYGHTHLARAVVPEADIGGAAYEEVTFETSDGLEPSGWYIPSKNRAAVVAITGRKLPRSAAAFLARNGYGVLLFDRRGEGEARETRTPSGGTASGTLTRRLHICKADPTSTQTALPDSGSRSGARC